MRAAGEDEYLRQVFEEAARQVHAAGGVSSALHQGLFGALNDRLQQAVTIGYGVADEAQTAFLRGNVQLFAGAKTAHETEAMSQLLLDESGALKPWSAFKLDALGLHEKYNVQWLRAEYEHAVASAQMAARWSEVQPGDMLQYQTAGDNRVRPEHAAWDNITRPADDEWWNTHYPPNGWLCRCHALVTAPGNRATPRSILPALPEPDPLFDNNVGKTGIIFPEKHPYFVELSKQSAEQVRKAAEPADQVNRLLGVSKSLKGARQQGVTAALDAINQVHVLPDSPTPNKTLPVSFGRLPEGTAGRFSFVRLRDVPPPKLVVSSALDDAGEIGFTLLHEMGHWIDYTYLDLPRNITMAKAHADIAGVLDAVEGTALWKKYEAMVADPATPLRRRELLTTYLMRPFEVWARVYSQYIAEHSADTDLQAAVARARGLRVPEQWEDDDFEPVRNAMRELFVKKKWTPIP